MYTTKILFLFRANNMTIRTDFRATGIYFINIWLINAMIGIEQQHEIEKFESIPDEFIPFIAQHQFKSKLREYYPAAEKNSMEEKIEMLMNPTLHMLTKDFVQVHINILSKSTPSIN